MSQCKRTNKQNTPTQAEDNHKNDKDNTQYMLIKDIHI